MISRGVAAVLNLQSNLDMISKSVSWQNQKEYYKKKGIRAKNLCIIDCKAYDLIDKALDAVHVLHHLRLQLMS